MALTTHPLEFPGNRGSAAYREYEAWQDAQSFEAVGAIWTVPEILGGENDGTRPPRTCSSIRGGPRLFEVLDVQAANRPIDHGRGGSGRELGSRGPHQRPLLGASIPARPASPRKNDPARRRRDDDHRRDAGRHRAEHLRAQRGPLGAVADQRRAGDQRGRLPHSLRAARARNDDRAGAAGNERDGSSARRRVSGLEREPWLRRDEPCTTFSMAAQRNRY